jgi:outer membrane protein assembly factor BamE
MPLPSSVRFAALGLAAFQLTACSLISRTMSEGLTSVITPYRVEIVQGNVVTSEQIAQIKPGRTRNEVRDILGSPLLADPFHAQRWDYVFSIRRPGTEPQMRTVVILFEGDLVKSVDNPTLPGEREFIASITRGKVEESKRKLELTEDERAALPRPAQAPASSVATAQAPARTYPPLEAP